MNIYRRIKDMKEDNDLTQQEVAKFLNVKRERYSKWENGNNEPPLEIFVKLSSFYNVAPSYLLGLSSKKMCVVVPGNFNMVNIGKNMKLERIKHGHLQKDVAKILKCSENIISNYERGKRSILTYKLVYFCNYYNCSVDNILL